MNLKKARDKWKARIDALKPEEAPKGYPNPYARRAAEAEAEYLDKTAEKKTNEK